MKKYIYEISILILSFMILFFILPSINEKSKELKSFEYIESKIKTDEIFSFKILGLKKFGAAFFWIKQIQIISKIKKEKIEEIKLNSEKISYLNPYLLGNYYLSSTVLALIKTRSKYDYAIEILERGIKYNPNEKALFFYMAGIVNASNISPKDLEDKIINLNDPFLIYILAYKYEEEYKLNKNKEDLKKAFNLWEMLQNLNNLEYKRKAEEKIEKYDKNGDDF